MIKNNYNSFIASKRLSQYIKIQTAVYTFSSHVALNVDSDAQSSNASS